MPPPEDNTLCFAPPQIAPPPDSETAVTSYYVPRRKSVVNVLLSAGLEEEDMRVHMTNRDAQPHIPVSVAVHRTPSLPPEPETSPLLAENA